MIFPRFRCLRPKPFRHCSIRSAPRLVNILAHVNNGRLSGLFAPALNRTMDRRTASRGVSPMVAAVAEAHACPASWDSGRTNFKITGAGWFAFQPGDLNALIRAINSNVTIDLRHLPVGRGGLFHIRFPGRFFAGKGSSPRGWMVRTMPQSFRSADLRPEDQRWPQILAIFAIVWWSCKRPARQGPLREA